MSLPLSVRVKVLPEIAAVTVLCTVVVELSA